MFEKVLQPHPGNQSLTGIYGKLSPRARFQKMRAACECGCFGGRSVSIGLLSWEVAARSTALLFTKHPRVTLWSVSDGTGKPPKSSINDCSTRLEVLLLLPLWKSSLAFRSFFLCHRTHPEQDIAGDPILCVFGSRWSERSIDLARTGHRADAGPAGAP